jgi:predicted transposase/invertase (TIGR01784 family)
MQLTGKYINPFTDFGFKKLFGEEFNKDLLLDFINQVLMGKEKIKTLTYLNTEILGSTSLDRRAFFDLYCENEKGDKIIIEMQNIWQEFFKDRSLYYTTFPLSSQAPKRGHWNYELKKVYTICILNFSFPDVSKQERCIREVQLLDTATHEVFYDKLSLIYLEMPRFAKREEELETKFDKWMYVLKNLEKLQARPRKLQERIFAKLFKEAEIANLNPKEMETYKKSLKTYWDEYSVLETAKKEGRKQGRMEGRMEGQKEGIMKVAMNMKKKGLDKKTIKDLTGLTDKQLAEIGL